MINNDQELQVMLERIAYFQKQIRQLRNVETNPANYRLSVGGYMAELDRMNLEVRDYLWLHPSEISLSQEIGVTSSHDLAEVS